MGNIYFIEITAMSSLRVIAPIRVSMFEYDTSFDIVWELAALGTYNHSDPAEALAAFCSLIAESYQALRYLSSIGRVPEVMLETWDMLRSHVCLPTELN